MVSKPAINLVKESFAIININEKFMAFKINMIISHGFCVEVQKRCNKNSK